ncbi:unnamed protein product [Diplocarpon coronariae]|uniref:Uncharacterized protein n=1 Tax=Diplocarpon coronariae TaxID=2795749 RepID=A0A218ZFS8_9HELO|nr:hypothetical protein B2J93_5083 [Marssonina coronariae]
MAPRTTGAMTQNVKSPVDHVTAALLFLAVGPSHQPSLRLTVAVGHLLHPSSLLAVALGLALFIVVATRSPTPSIVRKVTAAEEIGSPRPAAATYRDFSDIPITQR